MTKYIKYLNYILRHKWYVFVECWKSHIRWQGFIHDWSKFRLSEFVPYARYFYGNYPKFDSGKSAAFGGLFKEDIKRHFDKAWLYHIHRNRHHWQYWLLQEDDGPQKNIPIPLKYLKEMLADWRGAGKAITGIDNTPQWYLDNAHRINLKIINRRWIERKLGV